MSDLETPLTIDVEVEPAQALVGVPVPVRLRLDRSARFSDGVRVRNVACADKEVRVDGDLLHREVELAPGESYRLTLYLELSKSRVVDLGSLYVELAGYSDLISAQPRKILFLPSLKREIAFEVEPICTYDEGTKLALTLHHNNGETVFHNLRATVLPDASLLAGRLPVVRSRFGPGDKEVFQIAVKSSNLTLHLSASLGGGESLNAEWPIVVRPVVNKQSTLFRFLEPRKLSTDLVVIRDKNLQGKPVGLVRSAYPLSGGGNYQVEIKPRNPEVTKLTLSDVPGMLYVRSDSHDAKERSWTFEIDVAFNDLVSRPERLMYKMESPKESMTGEIHLTLRPTEARLWRFAVTVGITVTVQGAVAVFPRVLRPDVSLEEVLGEFTPEKVKHLVFLLSIPLAWITIRVIDWFWSRLNS